MGKRGVLVIAHGSSKRDWVRLVDDAVSLVALDAPVVASFLELVPDRSIPVGIEALKRQGVTHLTVVPLFVSSGSTHIEEIGHLLGVKRETRLPMEEEPLEVGMDVHLCPAMDDHPLIVDILAERARDLSSNPAEEALVLVGHGSDVAGFYERWETGMRSLAGQLQAKLGFRQATYAMTLPDNVRERLLGLATRYRVLVLPLFLSEGYFTRVKIPARMQGVQVVYTGQAYLPSPLVSRWIEAVVQEAWASGRQ
ncbi:sirohydrochlorin chelatase [Laceyella putida]|uniref:Sirohydrochlorin chelatase n=1 Tax=Laceyella putida TaxID=110101 RepID=A0ABW2RLE6_9BACL